MYSPIQAQQFCYHGIILGYRPTQYWEAVRVRTDKANFGPSPIGLIFSVNVNHYIHFTNISFIWNNSIFFIFYETDFKVTSKLANLPWPTLKLYYKRWTHSFLLYHADYFKCKSLILNILTVKQLHSVKVCRSYEFSKIPPTKLLNEQSVTCLKLKAISSNVGPNLETNL